MSKRIRRALVGALLGAMIGPQIVAASDEGDPEMVFGQVTFVSGDAVEMNGRRAVVTRQSTISSDGRDVSLASVRRGMRGAMEIDPSGRLLELRVEGVVE